MPNQSELGNNALYHLSTRKKIQRSEFGKSISLITNYKDEKNSNWYVWRVIRNLSALGHIEILEVNRRMSIYINNPSLVRLPSLGKPSYVLTGSRYPNTLELIEKTAKKYEIEIETIPNLTDGIAPDTIILKIDNPVCSEFCDELSIRVLQGYPANDIGKFAVSCEQILENNFAPHALSAENFKTHFDLNKLKFVRGDTDELPALKEHFDDRTHERRYYLFNDQNECLNVQKDYARYAFLAMQQKKALKYDPMDYELSIPKSLPLPLLLERALTLCSGLCPKYDISEKNVIFEQVPREIGEMIFKKLSQSNNL